ncbi:hypothetical protein J7J90_04070 [Candidatus Micrarchaeota archaeon]|nr:hypothetical protein [Candidatus Micrarchaeota archaeon]
MHTDRHTDGYWLFKNLFQTTLEKKDVNDNQELEVNFLRLVRNAPDYDIREFEDIVEKAWGKKINPIMSKVIIDILIDKVEKIEHKARHNKINDKDYDFINDISTLLPNPYSHSPLLGNDAYKISQLRQSVKNIMKYMEESIFDDET